MLKLKINVVEKDGGEGERKRARYVENYGQNEKSNEAVYTQHKFNQLGMSENV